LAEYVSDEIPEREIRESRKVVDENGNNRVELPELIELFRKYVE
jgi:hypothetical protein